MTSLISIKMSTRLSAKSLLATNIFFITALVCSAQEPVRPTKPTASPKVTVKASVDKCVSRNCVNGKGKKVYANDDVYEGNFVKGKREGRGIFTSLDVYTGQFANDKYNGKGKLEGMFSDIYEGDFVDGKKQGLGTYTNPSFDGDGNEVYTGQFANDDKNGKGKTKYSNGDAYDGSFVDGKFEGQGTYTFINGDHYIGEWKNSKRNGYGKECIKATNTVTEGVWKDDVFQALAAKTPKTENDWKVISEPFVSKMETAVNTQKDDNSAKQIYTDFDAATKDAGTSTNVRNTRKALLKTMHRSNSYPLMTFVREKLKTLNFNEDETKDILSPKLFYV